MSGCNTVRDVLGSPAHVQMKLGVWGNACKGVAEGILGCPREADGASCSSRRRHFFRGTHKVRNHFGSIFNYIF